VGLGVPLGVGVGVTVGVGVAVGEGETVGDGVGVAHGGISYVFETFPGGRTPAGLQKSWVKKPETSSFWTPPTHICGEVLTPAISP
jgi:hypothetical protein